MKEPLIPGFALLIPSLDSGAVRNPADSDSSLSGAHSLQAEVLACYHSHAQFLSRFAKTMIRDKAAAQDAVQEAFFRYFVHRKAGNEVDDPREWLLQNLQEFIKDTNRAGELEEAIAAVPPRIEAMSDVMLDVNMHLPVLLSPRELQVLRLRAQGLRYEEIARALNITSGSVGTMIARSIKKLRAEFLGKGRYGNGQLDILGSPS